MLSECTDDELTDSADEIELSSLSLRIRPMDELDPSESALKVKTFIIDKAAILQ